MIVRDQNIVTCLSRVLKPLTYFLLFRKEQDLNFITILYIVKILLLQKNKLIISLRDISD